MNRADFERFGIVVAGVVLFVAIVYVSAVVGAWDAAYFGGCP